MTPPALLVIGIHREELAFGRAVAAGRDPAGVAVLEIADGLPGRQPRQDERFRHDAAHRALYLQLPAHMRGRHRLLIDLHCGLDTQAPGADIYSRAPESLAPGLRRLSPLDAAPRLVRLGGNDAADRFPAGRTVIPAEVWQAADFLYVGLEIYLATPGAGTPAELAYARALIDALVPAAASLPLESWT